MRSQLRFAVGSLLYSVWFQSSNATLITSPQSLSTERTSSVRSAVLNHNLPRDGPRDFIDHEAPVHFVAMGDSYTSGPGAGRKKNELNYWDEDEKCRRTKGSYAVQLTEDYPFETSFKFDRKGIKSGHDGGDFIACHGHKSQDVVNFQIDKLKKRIEISPVDYVIMTIGGNNARFEKILRKCIFGIVGKGEEVPAACDQILEESKEFYGGEAIQLALEAVYDKIFEQIGQTDRKRQIYHILYPRPFAEGDNSWCDEHTMLEGVAWWKKSLMKATGAKPQKMEKSIREKINLMVDGLNAGIIGSIEGYHSNMRSSQVSGWSVSRIFAVDPNPRWEGNRFCEPGVESYEGPEVNFIPASGTLEPSRGGPVEHDGLKRELDADTCLEDEAYDIDLAYVGECHAVLAEAENPKTFNTPEERNEFKQRAVTEKEWVQQIFHPRHQGFNDTMKVLSESIVHERSIRERDEPTYEYRTTCYKDDENRISDHANWKFIQGSKLDEAIDTFCDGYQGSTSDQVDVTSSREFFFEEDWNWDTVTLTLSEPRGGQVSKDRCRKLFDPIRGCDNSQTNNQFNFKWGGEVQEEDGVTIKVEPKWGRVEQAEVPTWVQSERPCERRDGFTVTNGGNGNNGKPLDTSAKMTLQMCIHQMRHLSDWDQTFDCGGLLYMKMNNHLGYKSIWDCATNTWKCMSNNVDIGFASKGWHLTGSYTRAEAHCIALMWWN